MRIERKNSFIKNQCIAMISRVDTISISPFINMRMIPLNNNTYLSQLLSILIIINFLLLKTNKKINFKLNPYFLNLIFKSFYNIYYIKHISVGTFIHISSLNKVCIDDLGFNICAEYSNLCTYVFKIATIVL